MRKACPCSSTRPSSPIFVEQIYNTGLYRLALHEQADWVPFLDADELLVTRGAERPHDILARVPNDIACLRVPIFQYRAPAPPAHPFERLTRRETQPHMHKVFARRLEPARISIYAGNHFAFVDGAEDHGLSQDRLTLAHVPNRSALQMARRTILARMKAIAAGEDAAAGFSTHQIANFDSLKQDPRRWLQAAEEPPAADLTEEAVPYRGGRLRYTQQPDELARLLALFAAQGEVLAQSHGRVLDRKRLIRRQMLEEAAHASRLL